MERVCALALCLLLSLCSATSPPKSPTLIPLNCNETNHAELAADLINEQRDHGFIIKPVRIKSIYEQKVESVAGSSLYYINFEVQETTCSVLSGKKWKECNEDVPFHERVSGECKGLLYISRPWRILKVLSYNCTLGTVPSTNIVSRCPDCPTVVRDITPAIKAKADRMLEKFNQGSNNTNYFKVDDIERVRTQWMFGQSYFIIFTIKETVCLKIQKSIVIPDQCDSLEDNVAHVGICKGSSYFEPNNNEAFSVSCEIYDPRHDEHHHHHHHHHKHGTCKQAKEGDQVKESKDNAGQSDAGAGEGGADAAEPQEKCELGKGKRCGHRKGHRHHCHPGHHHHHSGHHHHHPGHHHHHDSHGHHDHHDHHDHHNHTSGEHGSSEEITDKQPFKRTKGSVQIYYPVDETTSIPVPTILRLPTSGKQTEETADFPEEPSPLETCPGQPISKSS